MARHVKAAAAVANSFIVPNVSRDNDDIVVTLNEVADSSELVVYYVCSLHI